MKSNESTVSPNVQRLLWLAVSEVSLLKKGEEFLVSDLFKGYEWKRILVRDRLLLGSLFLSESKTNAAFSAHRKSRSNLQIYCKN